MSYTDIKDPSRRDKIVQDYIARKNRLKENFRVEHAQKLNASQAQEEFFAPVTRHQAKTTTALEQLDKNQRDTANTQNQFLEALPYFAGPQADSTFLEGPTRFYDAEDETVNLDALMQDALAGSESGAYNVRWNHNRYVIGTKRIRIGNGKVRLDEREYPATKGLLQLLTRKTPTGYDEEDLANYSDILDKSDAIYLGGNRPVDKNSAKWKNIVRPIWEKLYQQRAKAADSKKAKRGIKKGGGVIFLSSDPNALVKRLQLLLASVQAGNNGVVRNEAVAILDELLRMKHIDQEEYKSILSNL